MEIEKKTYEDIFVCSAMILGFAALFAQNFSGDMACWEGWTRYLRDKGYEGFSGNYPPLFIHWLWLVGKIYDLFGISIVRNLVLELLVMTPVLVVLLVFIKLIWQRAVQNGLTGKTLLAVGALAAFNPAIYLNGPVWGQVDLLPMIFILIALLFTLEKKNIIWVPTLICVSLLTKFQMVLFLPIFGGIFFQHKKEMGKGILIAIPVIVIVLLPYILTGNLVNMINNAYIHTTSQYPYSTINAANLWMLLAGNQTGDNLILFSASRPATEWYHFFITPKGLGMVSFFLLSVIVMLKTALSDSKEKLLRFSFLMTMAFFTLLPGMHERYLFPAVPVAILWTAYNPRRILPAVGISLLSFFNMNMLLTIQGTEIWLILAVVTVLFFLYSLTLSLKPEWLEMAKLKMISFPGKSSRVIPVLFFVIWSIILGSAVLLQRSIMPASPKTTIEVSATQVPMVKSSQDYGDLNINKSVEGNPLKIRGNTYPLGFGTHAHSEIVLKLHPKAIGFQAFTGIDDEVEDKTGKVRFKVMLDGQVIWTGEPLGPKDKPEVCKVSFKEGKQLTLLVEEEGSILYDHADWAMPVIFLEP